MKIEFVDGDLFAFLTPLSGYISVASQKNAEVCDLAGQLSSREVMTLASQVSFL